MNEPPDVRLYAFPGSHACRTAILMLEHKRIRYRTVHVPVGLHPALIRLHGFDGRTVPALRVDDRRVQTNREIARYLDELQPSPPLLPADPRRRRAVEEAERWGDEVFQMTARRLALCGMTRLSATEAEQLEGGPLGVIFTSNPKRRLRIAKVAARAVFNANPDTECALLDELPPQLDRIDAWIADGTLNAVELSSADFLIAPSLCLLGYRLDGRAEIERRPCGVLAARILPWSWPRLAADPAIAGAA